MKNKFLSKIFRGIWAIIWSTASLIPFRKSSFIKIFLIKLFGGKVGKNCLISPGVKILIPWNLLIDDDVAIAENVNMYNHDKITIGHNVVISEGAILCTGTHKYWKSQRDLFTRPITIGPMSWICMEAFILPGCTTGKGTVIGARSVIGGELTEWTVYSGNPGIPIKTYKRE